MREVLGFQPKYTTEEAFEDYLRGHGRGPLSPERIARVERGVWDALAGGGHHG
jgi:UDP-glucose 4-epimerase